MRLQLPDIFLRHLQLPLSICFARLQVEDLMVELTFRHDEKADGSAEHVQISRTPCVPSKVILHRENVCFGEHAIAQPSRRTSEALQAVKGLCGVQYWKNYYGFFIFP